MRIGEQWAYREPPHTPGKACTPVEVLQFGPPKRQKVRIRLLAGEYPGLDLWVPLGRLLVPWEHVDAYLDDERRYEAEALRADVARPRELVLEAARRRNDAGHPQITSRLRKAIGAP